jgi:thiol:disulfide interchange protein DsbA
VVFKKVPVSFGRAAWENLGRIYYALDALGELQRLDSAVFEAIHGRKANLFTEDAAVTWAQSQGVNPARFKEAFRGFSTETRLARADQLSRVYKVDSVPMLVVAGRYRVLGRAGMGYAGKLAVADEMIARARKDLGLGGKK